MAEQTTPETEHEVEYVCIGKRVTTDGKLVYAWQQVVDLKAGKPTFNYWTKLGAKQGAYTGGRFMFTATETGTYTSGTKGPRSLGLYPDKDLVAAWSVASKAAQIEHDAKSQLKKLQGVDRLVNILEPISKVYRVSNRAQKAAIIAAIITVLEGGK